MLQLQNARLLIWRGRVYHARDGRSFAMETGGGLGKGGVLCAWYMGEHGHIRERRMHNLHRMLLSLVGIH